MLPENYHAKACRLFRIAASRIQQEKLTTTKESAVNDDPTTNQQPAVTSSRKRGNLRKSSDPGKAKPGEQTGTDG